MNQNFYNQFQNMDNSTINNQSNFNTNIQYGNEYKPPKKNNMFIIVVAIVAIISIIIGCILMLGGHSQSSDKLNSNNKENNKEIRYFNKENQSTNSLFFDLQTSSEYGKGVFFGIKGKDVASNLKFDSYSLFNNVIEVKDYDKNDGVTFYHDENYFNFELESGHYVKDSTGEYFDDEVIAYKSKNFFVTETNIDSYLIYYFYDEEEYYFADDDEDEMHRTWNVFQILFCDSIDEAKEEIANIRKNIDICIYDKQDELNNCITEDGKKINYKEYRYIKDLIIDSLKDYNLYLTSYEDIDRMEHDGLQIETYVNFEGIDDEDLTGFEIELCDYSYDKEEYNQSIKLNGMDVPVHNFGSLYYAALSQTDGFISISIDLPYEVEGNLENVQKALTIAFSKTK